MSYGPSLLFMQERFIHPDRIGSSEYRAIWECVLDALAINDLMAPVAILDEFINHASSMKARLEVPVADRGTAILEDSDDVVHICAPFCPTCGTRLTATGSVRFHSALIDREGWHDTDGKGDIETECSEVAGWCDECEHEVGLYFCYGAEENCRKETACPGTTTGVPSEISTTTATAESPEPVPVSKDASPEEPGEGGDASSESGSTNAPPSPSAVGG